jgi:hypothetical protein
MIENSSIEMMFDLFWYEERETSRDALQQCVPESNLVSLEPHTISILQGLPPSTVPPFRGLGLGDILRSF